MLKELNYIQKIIIAASTIFIIITIVKVAGGGLNMVADSFGGGPPYISVEGENGKLGIYDPDIEYDPVTKQAYMIYSSLYTNSDNKVTRQHIKKNSFDGISSHLASSFDGGKNWKKLATVFQTKNGEVLTSNQASDMFAKGLEGMWRYEQPTIIHTPKDTGREWKAYAYKYFWDGKIANARKYGIIVYKSSSNPSEGWSNEVKLFGTNNEFPVKPYNDNVALKLNRLDKSLADIKYYSDPSALYAGGVIFMTLTAYIEPYHPDRTILIASTNLGRSWSYINTLVNKNDAPYFGKNMTSLSNSSLIKQNNKIYLATTYGNRQVKGQGFAIMPFANIIKGQIKRDKKNKPIIIMQQEAYQKFLSSPGIGRVTFNENIKEAGFLMPQVNRKNRGRPFNIYNLDIFSIPAKD